MSAPPEKLRKTTLTEETLRMLPSNERIGNPSRKLAEVSDPETKGHKERDGWFRMKKNATNCNEDNQKEIHVKYKDIEFPSTILSPCITCVVTLLPYSSSDSPLDLA